MRQECEDALDGMAGYIFRCDRKADHKGKHRQRFYGDDGTPFDATMRWRRRPVRPTG